MTATLIPEGFDTTGIAPYSDLCGPLLYKYEQNPEGKTVGSVGLLLEAKHIGGNHRAHGGLLMTLLDEALGMNACLYRDLQPAVTVSMTTQFFAPILIGQFLYATASVTQATRSLAFMQGQAWCGDTLVGTANGVWKYLKTG